MHSGNKDKRVYDAFGSPAEFQLCSFTCVALLYYLSLFSKPVAVSRFGLRNDGRFSYTTRFSATNHFFYSF